MKIIIDIGHPAHVHLFKYFAWEMQKKGHKILFSVRDKENEIYLLKEYGFRYKSFGRHFKSRYTKIIGLFKFNTQLLFTAIKFNPDIFISHGSIYAAHVSWIMRKPHISLEDTGNDEQVRLYMPFTSTVLTSDIFPKDYGRKQIRYSSHHEIAYLHPEYFKPNGKFKETLNLKLSDKYIILRFVSWNASHDHGQAGIDTNLKQNIVEYLSKEFIVYISSESKLPANLEQYKINIPPDKIHDALYHAELFIGEGTTMAMEAAILGTPSIYINTLQYANVKDMEAFGLLFRLENVSKLFLKTAEILNLPNKNHEFTKRKEKMLSTKINLTKLLIWFIENYPKSVAIMKSDPDFQYNFQ